MKKTKTLSVIVPTYNEEQNLPRLIPALMCLALEQDWHVIFVDDCSTDSSLNLLKKYETQYNYTIIHNKVNKGYGGAIKEGINKAKTDYIITIDADGQHEIKDIIRLFNYIIETDADMVIGNRGSKGSSLFRQSGKQIIKNVAKVLMPLKISDLNSGMKIYNTILSKKYKNFCPDTMAYSDVIALAFINQKHMVLELPITAYERQTGKSTISISTAFQTIIEILNIVTMFNPLNIFLPISIFCLSSGLIWGVPIVIKGKGISVGALMAFITGLNLFFLGLLAEQIGKIRKNNAIE